MSKRKLIPILYFTDPEARMTSAFNEFDSRRLWSLWDIMKRFRASSFGAVLSSFARVSGAVEAAKALRFSDAEEINIEAIRKVVAEAKQAVSELHLSHVLRSQYERLEDSVKRADSAELSILMREFHNNLIVELTSSWFLMISADRRDYYEQPHPPFGDVVTGVFPEASQDIAAASRCLSLDEWTACVFHLMRVLEHGLRWMAINIGLPEEATKHENWKNVVDQIEKKIREMEAAPKSAEKIERLQMYSSMAVDFRYFKDAWRNHVAHSHQHYDQHAGETVWVHVRSFMQSAAKNSVLP